MTLERVVEMRLMMTKKSVYRTVTLMLTACAGLVTTGCGRDQRNVGCPASPPVDDGYARVGDVKLARHQDNAQLTPMSNCANEWQIRLIHFDRSEDKRRSVLMLAGPDGSTGLLIRSPSEFKVSTNRFSKNFELSDGRKGVMTCSVLPNPIDNKPYGACSYGVEYSRSVSISGHQDFISVDKEDWIYGINSIVDAVDKLRSKPNK